MSELQKRKEKGYFQKINSQTLQKYKTIIDQGESIRDLDLDQLKGPDKEKLINYLKLYHETKTVNKKGFQI